MMQLNNPHFSWRKVFTLSAGFLLALSVSTACKKRENTLGSGALTPESLLASGATDTFSLRTYTVLDSTVVSDDPASSLYALLGATNDNRTGLFNASFYSQFTYGTLPDVDEATSIIVDSVVLGLEYRGYYGSLDPMTFEIYQLDEAMSFDSSYYASSELETIPGNLIDPAYATQTPDPSGVTVVGGDTIETQLRLHLTQQFGTDFMEDMRTGNSGFASVTDFQTQYFKGLYVKVTNPNPPSGTGSVLYFRLDDSKLTFYFHLDSATNPQYEFDLTPKNCAKFNHVNIDNSAAVDQVIADTVSGANEFYAQAFRSRAVVEFDGISQIPKNSIIHNALLVLPISFQTYSPFYPSANLSVSIHISDTDDNYYSVQNADASYNSTLKRYVIDLRAYVQAVVSGETINSGIYLAPKFYVSSAERIIFNGPNTTNRDKPKLIVSYTEY